MKKNQDKLFKQEGSFAILLHINPAVAFAITNTKICNHNLCNPTETTKSIYSCIFYLVDNDITDTEQSSEHFLSEPSTTPYWNLEDPRSSSDIQQTNIQ